MSLIDDLRKVENLIPTSHVPSLGEVIPIVGALIAHAEHGESLFEAAAQGAEAVAKLFAPAAADVAEVAAPELAPVIAGAEKVVEALPEPAAPAAPVVEPQSDAAKVAELSKTVEQLQVALAAAQRGTVTVSEA